MTTATLTAEQTLAKLAQRLDFWESNLRSNHEHYVATGRDPIHYFARITAELGMIDSVREILDESAVKP